MKKLLIAFVGVVIAGCGGDPTDVGFDENDISSITAALKSEDVFTRQRAAQTLGNKGSEAASAVPGLMEVAKKESEDGTIRAKAIEAVGKIGTTDQATLDALEELKINKPSKPVRDAAKAALEQLGQ